MGHRAVGSEGGPAVGLLLYLGTWCHRDACVRARLSDEREAGPAGRWEDTSSWREPGPGPAAGKGAPVLMWL